MSVSAAEIAFLGHAFLRPDAGFLANLASDLDLTGFRDLVGETAADLEIEYNRLFLNPVGSPCLLWQSAYGDDSHLMGEAHLSALDWFRRYGVEPSSSNEPADHVGLLLLFCARLLDSEDGSTTVEQFRAEHLAWMPVLCDSIERESKHPFWTAVARRTSEVARAI